MPKFNGTLTKNEVFNSLFNMIISHVAFADNIEGLDDSLVDKNRVDGSMYGDTKLYTATDVGTSHEWKGDKDTNVLALNRPTEPKTQAIYINKFRQIEVTTDNILSKRAWQSETAFAQFTSIILQWVRDTKRIYDYCFFNTFIGTDKSAEDNQNKVITLPVVPNNPEAEARLQGQTIAAEIALMMIHLRDASRDYNDNGFLRAYPLKKLRIVWSAERLVEINMIDLPTIFHNKHLKPLMSEESLPARFFGDVNASPSTTGSANLTIRSMIEKEYPDKVDPRTGRPLHIFPGDLLPDNTAYGANETYTEDPTVLCKIMHEDSTPFMSGFETGTEFWNPKSLTTNHYLTWGHNTMEHIAQYPMITVKTTEAAAAAKK